MHQHRHCEPIVFHFYATFIRRQHRLGSLDRGIQLYLRTAKADAFGSGQGKQVPAFT